VIRLFASELLRARSRRMVPILMVFAILGSAIGMTIAAFNSHSPTQAQLDDAQRRADKNHQACLEGKYFGRNDQYPPEYDSLEEACDDVVRPENFLYVDAMRLAELPQVVQGVAFVIVVLGLVIGASIMGAEYSAGTVGTLLTWEPRRIRVLLARAAAAVIAAVAVAVVALTAFSLFYAIAATLRGVGDAPGVWGDTLEAIGRVVVAVVVGSLIALSLATIARSTAGGLGILLGYMVLVEGFIRGFNQELGRILIAINTFVFVSGKPQTVVEEFTRHPDLTTPTEAFMVMVVWAVALLAFALVIFRSRDVT
jgi:ABC-2 type transport system permease protein